MQVADVMTREVVTVRPTTPIKDVARLLVEHGISGVPVVEDGAVVGVVSEGDLLVKELGAAGVERRPLARIFGDSAETRAELAKALALTAGDAMTSPPITITSGALVAEAGQLLSRRRVNRLPVVDGGNLVGIVTRADVVRAFARPDEEIARSVWADVLHHTLWLDPDSFDVTVTNGVVRIRGHVERRSEAEMIEHFTSMVPGVTRVEPELSWSVDDRAIQAPARDLVSRYTADDTRRR
jgi:CBS domain-containing protein